MMMDERATAQPAAICALQQPRGGGGVMTDGTCADALKTLPLPHDRNNEAKSDPVQICHKQRFRSTTSGGKLREARWDVYTASLARRGRGPMMFHIGGTRAVITILNTNGSSVKEKRERGTVATGP